MKKSAGQSISYDILFTGEVRNEEIEFQEA
jgi:hypothetical protein